MTDIVERLRDEWHHSEDLCFEAADEIERLRHDISRLMSSLSGEVTESERLRSYLASCVAMIQHAIGTGNDVFIEPDTERKLSHARAALEGKK